jgi:hypothetical protein
VRRSAAAFADGRPREGVEEGAMAALSLGTLGIGGRSAAPRGALRPPMRATMPEAPTGALSGAAADPEALSIARSWIDSFGGGAQAEARAIEVMREQMQGAAPLFRQRLEAAIASVRSRDYVRGERNSFSQGVEEAWPEIYSQPDAPPMRAAPEARQGAEPGQAVDRPMRGGLSSRDTIRAAMEPVSTPQARRASGTVEQIGEADPLYEAGTRRYRARNGIYVDVIPGDDGVAQVQFSPGPNADRANLAEAIQDVTVALQRDMDQHGARVYTMLGHGPQHDRVYRQLLESGAFDPGNGYTLRMNSGAELGDRARAVGEIATGRARPGDYDLDYLLRGPQGADRMPFVELRRTGALGGRPAPSAPALPAPSQAPSGALTRPPVEIGRATDGSVLPVRPREPIRQSMVGGSDDLVAAARFRAPDGGNAGALTRLKEQGFDTTTPLYRGHDGNPSTGHWRASEGMNGEGV